MRVRLLEVERVLAVLLLLRIVAISRAMPAGCGRLQMINSRVMSGRRIATFQATEPPQS